LIWVPAGSDNIISLFFVLTVKGILPSVAIKEISLDQLKTSPDWVYHLLVNSLATVPEFVEFGSMTRPLSPYTSIRYQTIIPLYDLIFSLTNIFPLLSTARGYRSLLGQFSTSRLKSLLPSSFKRTNLLDVNQLYEENASPMRIFPPFSTATDLTLPLNQLGLINPLSKVPSAFKRATWFIATQLYVEKVHQTTIFPSLSIATDITVPLNQSGLLNPVSKVPSAFKRVRYIVAVQLYAVKSPPTIILPSGCIARVFTAPLNQVQSLLNPVSKVPSAFKRVKYFAAVQLYCVNTPPTNIFSSFPTAIAYTGASNPPHILKESSMLPSS